MRLGKRLYHLLKRKWQRKQSLPYSILPPIELFDSIKTLVKDSWDEIHETGDVFILSKSTAKRTNKIFRYCSATWDSIIDQHITKFSMTKDYLDFKAKEAEVAELKIDYAISQNNWDLLLLNVGKRELESITPKKKYDPVEEKIMLELALKKDNIDTSIITVDKFYTMLNIGNKMVANG